MPPVAEKTIEQLIHRVPENKGLTKQQKPKPNVKPNPKQTLNKSKAKGKANKNPWAEVLTKKQPSKNDFQSQMALKEKKKPKKKPQQKAK